MRARMWLAIGSILVVSACGSNASSTGSSAASPSPSGGQARTYYIAADEVTWDYVPGGVDLLKKQPFQQMGFFKAGTKPGDPPKSRPVSTKYVKALYREYTDATFKTLKPR